MGKITFEEALKHAAKAVSDKDVQEFLSISEADTVRNVTGNEIECCCDECNYLMDCCSKFRKH